MPSSLFSIKSYGWCQALVFAVGMICVFSQKPMVMAGDVRYQTGLESLVGRTSTGGSLSGMAVRIGRFSPGFTPRLGNYDQWVQNFLLIQPVQNLQVDVDAFIQPGSGDNGPWRMSYRSFVITSAEEPSGFADQDSLFIWISNATTYSPSTEMALLTHAEWKYQRPTFEPAPSPSWSWRRNEPPQLLAGSFLNSSYVDATGEVGVRLVTAKLSAPPPAPVLTLVRGSQQIEHESALDWAGVPTGSVQTLDLTVRNTGNAPLLDLVVNLSSDAGGVFILSSSQMATSLNPGQTTTFSVTFAPSSSGSYVGALQLTSNDVAVNPFEVSLTGTGLVSEIQVLDSNSVELVTGSVVGFGSTAAKRGAGTSQSLIVKNVGLATLTQLKLSKLGALPSDFVISPASLPTSLAPGASVEIVVQFVPSNIGSRTATLRIESNDSDEAILDIDLEGTGLIANQGVPDILSQSSSQMIALGSPLDLQLLVQGQQPLRFQWSRNKKNLVGEISSQLLVPTTSLASAATYQCTVSNSSGGFLNTVPSSEIRIGIVDRKPIRHRRLAGSALVLSVICAGTDLSYQWYYNGDPIAGAIGKSYSIRSLQIANTGQYFCRVSEGVHTLDGGLNTVEVYDQKPLLALSNGDVLTPAMVSSSYLYEIPIDPESRKAPTRYVVVGLPKGLVVDGANGVITGKPRVSKPTPYSVKITVSNGKGSSTVLVALMVTSLPTHFTGQFTGSIPRSAELNGNFGGRLDVTFAKSGVASGKIVLGKKSWPTVGSLDANIDDLLQATANFTIVRKGLPNLTIRFRMNGPAGLMEDGEVTDGFEQVYFQGWRRNWNRNQTANAFSGGYTFLVEPPLAQLHDVSVPQGFGYGSFSINDSTGSLRVTGKMPDNSTISYSTFAGSSGQILCFQLLGSGGLRGSIVGEMQVNDVLPKEQNLVLGTVNWWCPRSPRASERNYADGFGPTDFSLRGGRYIPPIRPQVFMNLDPSLPGNARLVFIGADGEEVGPLPSPDVVFGIGSSNRLAMPQVSNNPRVTRISLKPSTGRFDGSFTLKDDDPFVVGKLVSRKATFSGQVVRDPTGFQRAYGFFMLGEWPTNPDDSIGRLPVRSGQVILEVNSN
jgi:hypothetical protein